MVGAIGAGADSPDSADPVGEGCAGADADAVGVCTADSFGASCADTDADAVGVCNADVVGAGGAGGSCSGELSLSTSTTVS